MAMTAYFRLMRLDKPVGIFLLWLPTAWALWIANQGYPPVSLVVYFALGTVLMRSAGCVVNDIADRHIDQHVQRTRLRPLTTGEVSLQAALGLLFFLLLAALLVLVNLPIACFPYAVFAVAITALYPFCKRFFQAPQFILGVAFSMGIPMAFVASAQAMTFEAWLLLAINFCWIVSYDTMYAMADKTDDLRVGIYSTAIWFGNYDYRIILLLQGMFQLLWLMLGGYLTDPAWFYMAWVLSNAVLGYQQFLIKTRNPKACFRAFQFSVCYGLIMWLGIWPYVELTQRAHQLGY